jgi:PST family polysaccharide transporter
MLLAEEITAEHATVATYLVGAGGKGSVTEMPWVFGKMLSHSVVRNTLALGVVQAANVLLPLVVLPYLTRSLGVSVFGVVAVVLASIQLAYVITDYGFSLSATYSIAQRRDDREAVSETIGNTFGAKILLALFGCLGLSIVGLVFQEGRYFALFAAGYLAVAAQAFQPLWLFQGLERMKFVTIYMVATKTLYALLVVLFVNGENDAVWVIWAWGGSQFVGTVLAIVNLYALGYRIPVPKPSKVVELLRESRPFFVSRVAVAAYTAGNTVIVGMFSSPIQAGYFAVCDQAYRVTQNLTAPLSQALFPYMASSRDWKLFYRIVSFLGVCIVVVCGFAFIYAETILEHWFGGDFAVASSILQVFMVITVVNFLSVVFGYPALGALRDVAFANYSVVAGALIHGALLIGLVLIGEVDPIAIVWCLLVTECVVMLLRVSRVIIHHKGWVR